MEDRLQSKNTWKIFRIMPETQDITWSPHFMIKMIAHWQSLTGKNKHSRYILLYLIKGDVRTSTVITWEYLAKVLELANAQFAFWLYQIQFLEGLSFVSVPI